MWARPTQKPTLCKYKKEKKKASICMKSILNLLKAYCFQNIQNKIDSISFI